MIQSGFPENVSIDTCSLFKKCKELGNNILCQYSAIQIVIDVLIEIYIIYIYKRK